MARVLRIGLSAGIAALISAVVGVASAAERTDAEPVLVALVLQVLGPAPETEGLPLALEALTEELELEGDVLAIQRVRLVGDWLQSRAADREELEHEALRAGARYRVLVSLTRAGSLESWDLEVRPLGPGPGFAHRAAASASQAGSRAREAVLALATEHERALAQAAPPELETPSPELPGSEPAPEPSEGEGGAVVAEIQVEGNRRIDAGAIRAALGTRVGEPLSQERVARDIRRVFDLGFFRNVEILSSPAVEGGHTVVVRVEENPVIRRVTIAGNDNLKSDELTEQLTLTIGSTIDYPLVIENEQRIQAIYQTKGYYKAQISYSIEEIGDDAVSVDYDVVEGKKLRLNEIHFVGNDALDDGELLRGLEVKPWGWLSLITHFWDHSGLYAEPIFYQDLDTIQKKYGDRGYIRADISSPEVEIDDDGIEVTVRIDEGPQFYVGAVDVLGDESLDRGKLPYLVALSPGDVFNRSALSDDVERMRRYYSDRGYYAAEVRPRTDVDPDVLSVDVLFEVEKKELFFVDWIAVSGNTRTRDEVVRRELSLGEGELYSDGAVERSKARVRRLGFFEEVEVETTQLDDRNVGVTLDVVERPTGSFSFGAGVGSTDGFLVNASIRQDNLFGRGWGVHASIDAGSRNQYGSLRFFDPYFLGTVAGFGFSLTFADREFLDFDQEIQGFGLDVSYPLDEGETRAGVGYGFSSREVTGFTGFTAASLIQREEFQRDTTTSLVSFSIRQDTRDDIRFPRFGHLNSAAIEFAGLGGLTQFVRLEGRSTYYLPLRRWLPFDSTFVMNSRIGWALPFNSIGDFDLPTCAETGATGCLNLGGEVQELVNIDDDLELALSERYFLGGVGAFQLRGFEQRSVGPRRSILTPVGGDPFSHVFLTVGRDTNPASATFGQCQLAECNSIFDTDDDDFDEVDLTDVIGGNKMFLLNLELRFPISEELGLEGIVFFDMGNAFAEDQAMNPADLRFSTGVGGQWFSPFGPILVFLGIPLNPLEDEDGSVFEFTLGGQQF